MMDMDIRLFARYAGYILQDLEREQIIAKVDKDRIDKEQEDIERKRKAAEAQRQREAAMKEQGLL